MNRNTLPTQLLENFIETTVNFNVNSTIKKYFMFVDKEVDIFKLLSYGLNNHLVFTQICMLMSTIRRTSLNGGSLIELVVQ